MPKYVLSHSKPDYVEEDGFQNGYTEIYKYAEFLDKKVSVDMFVSCDINGGILQEPSFHEPKNENEIGSYQELIDEYENGKENILFNGFSFLNNYPDFWLKSDNSEIRIYWDLEDLKWRFAEKDYTINDLIQHNLELTKKGLTVMFGKAII